MHMMDATGNNITAIKKGCKKLINKKEVKIIIIDYIQLISAVSNEENRDAEITKIN